MDIDKEFDNEFAERMSDELGYNPEMGKLREDIQQFYHSKISKLLNEILLIMADLNKKDKIGDMAKIIKLINKSEFKHLINK